MALVQTNVCEPFDRISQREVLARILAEDVEPDEHSSSDSEIEPEERGKITYNVFLVYQNLKKVPWNAIFYSFLVFIFELVA